MSINGIQTAQAAMLQVLTQSNSADETTTSANFQTILTDALADIQTGPDSGSSQSGDLSSSVGSLDLTSLMMLSMLSSGAGGGSNMMMVSLGEAFSRVASGQTSAFAAAALGTSASALSAAPASAYATSTDFGTTVGIYPESGSKPVTPSVTSSVSNRNPAQYTSVIGQFNVETNRRYTPNKGGTGDTYCNIFMWDVTRAMGAEIPHYIDPETGAPVEYPNVSGAQHQNANRIYDWLGEYGEQYGWYEVTPEQAQNMANDGHPVVTAFKKSGHGHVQVVCPSKDGVYDEERGVTIAQAGRRLTNYRPITEIYNASLKKVKYYAHA